MYEETYQTYLTEIEGFLQGLFLTKAPYRKLQEAMRYSLLAGGKRLRPVLSCAFAQLFGGDWHRAVPLGCALELVHTYSLIHDDLPCMDNDNFRRGKPTCHKKFDETLAVLAGDALQPEAFTLIAQAPDLSAEQRIDAVMVLARAAGADGMVAGQVLDTLGGAEDGVETAGVIAGITSQEARLRQMCQLKTGAMIRGAAELGCIAAGASALDFTAAGIYAGELGLGFQIRDDMLDVIAEEREFGKPIGSDRAEGKTTFVDILGLEGCDAAVAACTQRAKAAVAPYPGSGFLLELADRMAERMK